MYKELIFAGAGHIGLSGLKSVQRNFERVYFIKDTPEEILAHKRKQDEVVDDFDAVECKLVFLCGYIKLIPKEQLQRKTYINVHGALLPKYRGMHATFWAIMNGEKELGVTFHLVNQWMDAGEILAQFKFEYIGQTVGEINHQIDLIVEEKAGEILCGYDQGKIIPIRQQEELALYVTRRNMEDCLIDFQWSNELLERYFHALTEPYPLPMLRIHGELYEVLDHILIERMYFGPVGRVVNMDEKGVWIKTQEGFLIILHVRKQGTNCIQDLRDIVKMGYRFS